MHVAATLKKHLRNLKIKTNVNVTSANRQKRHAKCITYKQVPISINGKLAFFYVLFNVEQIQLLVYLLIRELDLFRSVIRLY